MCEIKTSKAKQTDLSRTVATSKIGPRQWSGTCETLQARSTTCSEMTQLLDLHQPSRPFLCALTGYVASLSGGRGEFIVVTEE